MGLFVSKEIKEGSSVNVARNHANKYPDHFGKSFKVLEITQEDEDEDAYCKLEWINAHANNRIVYIPKNHLVSTN